MPNENLPIHIVVCQSIELEMKRVAEEAKKPYLMTAFSSSCHRQPEALGCLIENFIDENEGDGLLFLAYGKCFRSSTTIMRKTFRLPAMNCASILLGGDINYQGISSGSYFLTPHLALNWKSYFLGGGDVTISPKNASRLMKWFRPMDRAILIELDTHNKELAYESALEFASIIQKPLVKVSGNLDFLKKHYFLFLSQSRRSCLTQTS